MNTSFRIAACALVAFAGSTFLSTRTATSAPNKAPAPVSVTRSHQAPDQSHPFLVSGVLSAPSTARPEQIARTYLATRPSVLGNTDLASLEIERTVPIGNGRLVRLQQRHNGLPVVGGEVRVRIDEQGRVRWVSSAAVEIPSSVDEPPALTPAQALAAAATAAGYDGDAFAGADATRYVRQAIYAVSRDVPRRAYWIRLPRDLARMQTIRAYVDAQSGAVLQLDNLLRHAEGDLPACSEDTQLAYVYDVSPAVSDLECVSLSDELETDATQLINADVAIGNCVDNDRCEGMQWGDNEPFYMHVCDLEPTAVVNADGNFTDYVFQSDTRPEDAFSEVQAFHHVTKVYAVARRLGDFTELNTRPIWAYVNYKQSADDTGCEGETYVGDTPLALYDNAFFSPGGGFTEEPDYMAFGQGAARDYAYDGDVVYHEFGHAVMYTIAPELGSGSYDVFGYNPTAGGLHEGFADLMTMFVTNDPIMAEYAGADAENGLRRMDNDKVCPDDLVGEEHYDGEPFTGAVWEARTLVADTEAKRTTFDEALYAAQHALGASDDLRTATAKILSEIEISFGTEAADQVEEVFTRRGTNGCNNRVMIMTPAKQHDLMYVPGPRRNSTGDFPAPVQYRYDLAEPATALRVSVQASAPSGRGTEPMLRVALKRSGNPIHWSFPEGYAEGFFDESTELALVPAESGGNGAAVFQGNFAPGTYHLQVYNQGSSWVLQGVRVFHSPAPGAPDAGPTVEVDAGDPGADTGLDDGGCGCRGARGGSGATGALVVMFLLVGIAVWPRRRRRTQR